jgi:cystathionine beta-lyase/cystathionine gamma-synthase
MESWLLLRSMRTLKIRVKNQSASSEKIAKALDGQPLVKKKKKLIHKNFF